MVTTNNNYCSGYKVISKMINVPYYNPYCGSELCEGLDEYSLCRSDVNVNLTLEEFQTKINEYKESKKTDKDEILDVMVDENNFDLIGFIIDYKYYILLVLFPLLIVLAFIIFKDKSKKRGIL